MGRATLYRHMKRLGLGVKRGRPVSDLRQVANLPGGAGARRIGRHVNSD